MQTEQEDLEENLAKDESQKRGEYSGDDGRKEECEFSGKERSDSSDNDDDDCNKNNGDEPPPPFEAMENNDQFTAEDIAASLPPPSGPPPMVRRCSGTGLRARLSPTAVNVSA